MSSLSFSLLPLSSGGNNFSEAGITGIPDVANSLLEQAQHKGNSDYDVNITSCAALSSTAVLMLQK